MSAEPNQPSAPAALVGRMRAGEPAAERELVERYSRGVRFLLLEIYNLDLDAELVVLSGCRTALGPEIRGEGLVGLTRGFFAAGARRLMASLWRVQDRSAPKVPLTGIYGWNAIGLYPASDSVGTAADKVGDSDDTTDTLEVDDLKITAEVNSKKGSIGYVLVHVDKKA